VKNRKERIKYLMAMTDSGGLKCRSKRRLPLVAMVADAAGEGVQEHCIVRIEDCRFGFLAMRR
jgi:hypothetical protein